MFKVTDCNILPFQLTNFPKYIFLVPAFCDTLATSTMYLGLTLTYASSFQMLRGERERERERDCLFVCLYVCMYVLPTFDIYNCKVYVLPTFDIYNSIKSGWNIILNAMLKKS